MALTLTQAQAALERWVLADEAVSKGQSYTIGDRTLTRAHVSEIRNQIEFWSKQEAELQRIANGGQPISVSLANFNL